MSTTDEYRRVAAIERESQERARAAMEQVYQLQGSIVPDTTGAKPAPSTSGKSILEQALDAHEGRNGDAHMADILGPAPGAAAPAPVSTGRDDTLINQVLDRMEAPC